METIKINLTAEEIVKVKFIDTLSIIEGYLTEAEGNRNHGTTYYVNSVYDRINNIKNTLLNDLTNLSQIVEMNKV